MDLDDFRELGVQADAKLTNSSASDALAFVDNVWYAETTRRGRWMDLVGDYAGNELFVVDGDSLLQVVLNDPLLALGGCADGISYQILHAKYTLEKLLCDFLQRSAIFDIVFWQSHRHSTQLGSDNLSTASRMLARKLLIAHLKTLSVPVHMFEDEQDPKWLRFLQARKPMFVMLNDGGVRGEATSSEDPEPILLQRIAIFQFMSRGLPCALLQGTEFCDSKILTFIFEKHADPETRQRLGRRAFVSAVTKAKQTLQDREDAVRGAFTPASIDDVSHDDDAVADTSIARFIHLASFDIRDEPSFAPCLLHAFTAHMLLLPKLGVRSRARASRSLHPQQYLNETFLPKVFLALEHLDNVSGLEVDGRVFLELLHYLRVNTGVRLREILGDQTFAELDAVWSACAQAPVDYRTLAKHFPIPSEGYTTGVALLSDPPQTHLSVLPFSHPVFDKVLSSIQLSIDEDNTDPSEKQLSDIPFQDEHHWHNHRRAILPKYLGGGSTHTQQTEWQRMKRLRSEQRFMANMQWQAESLTGASGKALQRITIVVGKKDSSVEASKSPDISKDSVAKGKGKKSLVKKADVIRQQLVKQKIANQDTSNATWWSEQLEAFKDLTTDKKFDLLDRLLNNSRTEDGWLAADIRLYGIHLEFLRWIETPGADSDDEDTRAEVRDRCSVSILRKVKDLYERGSLLPTAFDTLDTVLRSLGLESYEPSLRASSPNPVDDSNDRLLSFKFVKLLRSKTKAPTYKYMRVTEDPVVWQMRLFGEFMDRSMDSQSDPRVSFRPDAWQREVLDCLDQNDSVLVVAPTSAGKTFISYYAMEQVLRGSDDDVLVYVAPTKALVSQIAAEVYARFHKVFKRTGKTCWSIHTRDYRVNDPQNCQILVTVPEMLAIMLLSPPLARTWTHRIKRIILDEIHTIGQQEGGAVWEQIILLAPCPIIGLSATIGEPEKFNAWLQSVQEAHGFKHTFIHHPHRYSHLRKFTYALQTKTTKTFAGLDTYQNSGRLHVLHPVSILAYGGRTLPPDFSMEAADCLSLYSAFGTLRKNIDIDISRLKPSRFFNQQDLLKQRDIINYENALKEVLTQVIALSDPDDQQSPLSQVAQALNDPVIDNQKDYDPTSDDILSNLIHLVSDLHGNGDLPALFFLFDRTGCEIAAQRLLLALVVAEQKWRKTSPKWVKKIEQWRLWQAQAVARQKAAERLAKINKKAAEDPQNARERTWEESFDPRDPSPQLSFLGRKASKERLEEAIKGIAWTSTPAWVISALKRGIGIHHSGMNKHYRTTVESLYRMGYLQVVFATGTLALGINAPTKTSVFCGDSSYLTALMYRQCAGRAGRRGYDLLGKVVFYGLPMDRVQRLVLSRLPSLGGNFPLTSTMVLRLFNLLQGSGQAQTAVNAIDSILKLPHVSFVSDTGRQEILHHIRFSIDYLRRSALMDNEGNPINLFGLATHLYYTEPSNFAVVALLREGVIQDICSQPSTEDAKRDLLLLLCHLFGRRYVPKVYTSSENAKALLAKSPSKVILPDMPEAARQTLLNHDRETVRIFTGYALAFARGYHDDLGHGEVLPLSGKSYEGVSDLGSYFGDYLERTALNVHARSPFVANSGHDDEFGSVEELVDTVRTGVHLKEHGVPSLQRFTTTDKKHPLNSYLLDFYMHGQTDALVKANGIRRGEIWYLLQDFTLTLKTIRSSVEQLLQSMSATSSKNEWEQDLAEDSNDPAEVDEQEDVHASSFRRPPAVSDRDWRMFEIFDALTTEFDEKFRAMWA